MDPTSAAIRHFNRFYTRRIGVLSESLLESGFGLAEARVMFEIARLGEPTAAEVASELGMDRGYLSRILSGLRQRKLITQERKSGDARLRMLGLTAAGRRAFDGLDKRATEQVRAMVAGIPREHRARLVDAFATIEGLLRQPRDTRGVAIVLRGHQPGDIGWVIERNGAIYAAEYGWNQEYEALVARVAAQFLERFDPERERCWIADTDGERVGCVFLVAKSRTVAQLRLLLVEPSARGLGLGTRLVDECTQFARAAGYRKIILWTNSVLVDARRIYERAGYQLTSEEPSRMFGQDLVGQYWEKTLR